MAGFGAARAEPEAAAGDVGTAMAATKCRLTLDDDNFAAHPPTDYADSLAARLTVPDDTRDPAGPEAPAFPLQFQGGSCTVNLGSNTFALQRGSGRLTVPVMIDNVPLIGFWILEGHLLLRVQIFDESNKLILRIWDNELQYKPVPWDIE